MRKRIITLAATALVIGGVSFFDSAQAVPIGLPDGARAAIDLSNILEPAHMWRGQNYCWYEDGWNGAGWYQCGYAGRKGYGWAVLMAGRMDCPHVGTSYGFAGTLYEPHDGTWLLLVGRGDSTD